MENEWEKFVFYYYSSPLVVSFASYFMPPREWNELWKKLRLSNCKKKVSRECENNDDYHCGNERSLFLCASGINNVWLFSFTCDKTNFAFWVFAKIMYKFNQADVLLLRSNDVQLDRQVSRYTAQKVPRHDNSLPLNSYKVDFKVIFFFSHTHKLYIVN